MPSRNIWGRKVEQPEAAVERSLSWDEFVGYFKFNGNTYGYPAGGTVSKQEEIAPDFSGLASQAFATNGVVFACCDVRSKLFQEARFQFQRMTKGRPGELWGDERLEILEEPWPGGTTRKLLARAIQDTDLAGNWFGAHTGGKIKRLRPDWVTIISGSSNPDAEPGDPDVEVIGYVYKPGGKNTTDPIFFLAGEVAHWAPIPDPLASYRGMSWLTPVVREIMGDKAATEHKLNFFEVGTPNLIFKVDPLVKHAEFKLFEDMFRAKYEDARNGLSKYAAMFIGGGADPVVVGNSFEQEDFKNVQGAGETRIAAAASVPPVIVGLSEGLQAATYSNYGQARRRFADGTMRPLWGDFADSVAQLIDIPGGSRLSYDARDIPFLQEDMKDAADIQQTQAGAIRQLVDAGFTPESVVDSVTADDFARLVHTNLFSVQLQPPGSTSPETNGTVEPAKIADVAKALEKVPRKEKA